MTDLEKLIESLRKLFDMCKKTVVVDLLIVERQMDGILS